MSRKGARDPETSPWNPLALKVLNSMISQDYAAVQRHLDVLASEHSAAFPQIAMAWIASTYGEVYPGNDPPATAYIGDDGQRIAAADAPADHVWVASLVDACLRGNRSRFRVLVKEFASLPSLARGQRVVALLEACAGIWRVHLTTRAGGAR